MPLMIYYTLLTIKASVFKLIVLLIFILYLHRKIIN